MKYLVIFLLLIGFSVSISAQTVYSRVTIDLKQTGIKPLLQLGISAENGHFHRDGRFITLELASGDLKKLQAKGIPYSVIEEDVSAFYRKRLEAAPDPDDTFSEWEIPENFTLGSMGGYLTLEEVMEQLDNMHTLFPDLISARQPASEITTVEGRTLYWVKISDNPETDEEESEVFYNSLIHAREPAGLMHLIFYMYYLLENYDSDPEIHYLVDNTEMYFMPVVNPDGYNYNHTTNPNGGGMWRKNRFLNSNGTYGIDLNRNFGYMWGYDNEGSSPEPSSDTYRGTGPFSEKETLILKEFCEAHEFRIALNYHTYSNLLLFPWGYEALLCADNERFMTFGTLMTTENGYTFGPTATTIYPANGGSDDWMYGEQETKNKIFAFTPEVGSSADGFWPAQSRILPLCRENMQQSLYAARFAGDYTELKDQTKMVIETLQSQCRFSVQQLGLAEQEFYTISIEPLSPEIIAIGESKTYTAAQIETLQEDSISLQLHPNSLSGTAIQYRYIIDNGVAQRYIEVEKIYGQTTTVFLDPCNTTNAWDKEQWNTTTYCSVSPPSSITDSPSGNYNNNTTNNITLIENINLTHTVFAQVTFYARWDIEAGYDYVEFLISADEGSTWTPLAGKYTHPGTVNQTSGSPVYDGVQEDWVQEEIDLTAFTGQNILLQFSLHSDSYVTGDGFYFDDLKINAIATEVGVFEKQPQRVAVYPLPATDFLTIRFSAAVPIQSVSLFTADGQLVSLQEVNLTTHSVQVNTRDLKPGFYTYSVQFIAGIKENGRFLKR
ncbi:MAG: M14 family zinc carboxypeptidase [Bacteroidales bacterium]|nr:M14 family zinc carboxypeptidase [Bacteroidales bacterium]